MTQLPRVMPALITPFTDREELDLDAHAYNVAAIHDRGAQGVLVAGSTGEGPFLEPGERRSLVATAASTVPSSSVVCGVNAESERSAMAQIDEAADGGAIAALVVTPTTLVRGRDVLVGGFYERVAARSALPILLYSVPGVTGWQIPTDLAKDLAAVPRIVGMKDSGGEPERLDEMAPAIGETFIVFAGASRAILESAARGAFGAITASGNYAFSSVAASAAGDSEAQARLLQVTSVVEPHGVAATKFAAGISGLRPGHARRPLAELSSSIRDDIERTLR
ncbi:MAG: dihydrodipicolinate synthase family protein [Acidimicrobiia bacterium]